MFTAIHVDDDIRSIDLMKLAAADTHDIELLASFTSGKDALEWLADNDAEIIFLDIEMPEQNGIDFAKGLGNYSSDVIFVTAHTGFAIQAFEACALDYLIKPIYPEKLQVALERYAYRKRRHFSAESRRPPMQEQMSELLNNYVSEESYPLRIFVSMVGEIRVVTLTDVLYFSASGPYTKIFMSSEEVIICSESIKTYSESLRRHPDFVRIHRSYLVNKQFIASIQRKVGNVSVKMSNGDILAIAQQRRNEIFKEIAS